jgi:hypothetical protein
VFLAAEPIAFGVFAVENIQRTYCLDKGLGGPEPQIGSMTFEIFQQVRPKDAAAPVSAGAFGGGQEDVAL